MLAPQDRIASVRATFGTTIQDVLAKEPGHDIFEILGAIKVLVGSKLYQKVPTSLGERMVFAFTWLAREVQKFRTRCGKGPAIRALIKRKKTLLSDFF
jgi:hypothetical protein